MKYMGDDQWWDNRFKARDLSIMAHEEALEDDIVYFPKCGKVLDLACGDGRNSVYLAVNGYNVVSVDFSKEALNRLQHFANQRGLGIETILMDLSKVDNFDNLRGFDAIIINHYRLNPDLYRNLMDCLNVNGILWVNGFSAVPRDNPDIKDDDVFIDSDFDNLNNYVLISEKCYQIDNRLFVRKVWKRDF